MFLLKKDMKNFVKYIICFLCFFNISASLAADISFEEEKIIEGPKEDITTIGNREYDMAEYAVLLARYFNNHYKGDKINDDLSEDLMKFFPEMSQQGIYDAEDWIRRGVKLYREGSKLYEKIVAGLTIKPTRKIFPDEDYDDDKYYDYIDTGKSDEYIVITDIKRVLAYGDNPQDAALMQAKKDHDAGREKGSILDEFKKLKKLWDEGRYRELLFFGSDEDSQKKITGISEYDNKGIISSVLAANVRGIMEPEKLKFGVLLFVPEGRFVAAENSGRYFVPEVDLSASDNLDFYKLRLPVPQRFNHSSGESIGVYGNIFLLPIEGKIKDASRPLTIRAKTKLQVCDYTLECQEVELNNELFLNDKDNFDSEVASFVQQAFNHLPEKNEIIGINKAVIDENEDGISSVRLEFFNKKKVRSFSVFMENQQKTVFDRPMVAVNGDNIFVRFEPIDKTQKFTDKKFLVRAVLNNKYAYEEEIKAEDGLLFDPRALTFSIGLLMVAFVGGFLLNFMPCVFPVLSLKIITLSKMEDESSGEIKRSIGLSIYGILGGFLLLATLLAGLKILGFSLGWGIQFQSVGFLGFMMFIVLLFLAELWGMIDIKTPEFINKYLSDSAQKNDFLSVLTGVFVVLMSTPCSAPFLGIAVGFALGSNILHIYLILMTVALGVCVPYFLILLMPKVSCKLPNDPKWRKRFVFVMEVMLLLTLAWLFGILSEQIGFLRTIWFLISLISIIIIFWLSGKFMNFMKSNKEAGTKEEIVAVKRFFLWLAIILSLISVVYLFYAQNKGEAEYLEKNVPEHIDFAEIKKQVDNGKIVVLEVGANWCLTCQLNDITAIRALKKSAGELNVVYMRVDWSRYNEDILNFMAKYGRRGLPFYVVYTKVVPDGIALPEILTLQDVEAILGKALRQH